MNYNSLERYTTSEQVYSHDLNQILSKTPPRLFKWGLVAFAFCLAGALLATFMIRQTKTVDLDYIAYTRNSQLLLTCIANKSDYDKMATAREALVKSDRDGKGHVATGQLRIDSIHARPFYERNGQVFEDAAAAAANLHSLNGLALKYKLLIYATPATPAVLSDGKGRAEIIIGRYRLIEKVFGFKR